MARVTLFHTSDMHSKLTPDGVDRLRALKESHPGSLMLDSGDAIRSGNIFFRLAGEPALDLMNSVPYDAMCMGNREFHFLAMGMRCKLSRARFEILSANIRGADDRPAPAPPYLIAVCEGVRVGVIGLTVPCITERMLVRKVSDYYFTQPAVAAAEMAPKLREESDIVIALTHIGIQQDRELARKVRGIDIILGGHTHTTTQQPERVGETWILHHGFYAQYVGKVDVEVTSGRVVAVTNELIPVSNA